MKPKIVFYLRLLLIFGVVSLFNISEANAQWEDDWDWSWVEDNWEDINEGTYYFDDDSSIHYYTDNSGNTFYVLPDGSQTACPSCDTGGYDAYGIDMTSNDDFIDFIYEPDDPGDPLMGYDVDEETLYYWDETNEEWVSEDLTPIPTNSHSPMGDPIDPITGLADVTDRFNRDIELAFEHFCTVGYEFGNMVDNYGNLMGGGFNYPVDFIDYMMYFYNNVKTGGPWDFKAVGNGYSYAELGNKTKAIYEGHEYNFDDFGNITFGIAALAYGFPPEFALAGAGFYQVWSGTSNWSYISSYFDDPRDSDMIELGYSIFYENGGCGF